MKQEHEEYWQKKLVEGPAACVACGKKIEQTPEGYANHKCAKKHEADRRGANLRGEDSTPRTPGWYERLKDGLLMLDASEDGDGLHD